MSRRFGAPLHNADRLDRLRGLKQNIKVMLKSGGRWLQARHLFDEIQELLREIDPASSDELCEADAAMLIGCAFFAPYMSDDVTGNRGLQNALGGLCSKIIRRKQKARANRYRESFQSRPIDFSGDRRIRVGYLSQCLREHSVGILAAPLLVHRSEKFEIFLYMIGERGVLDPLQAWYVANADSTFRSRDPWILADRISDDCIDILVDLDSVTTDVACMVVALKPAPMICSWLGWDASGLPEVDYYLADKDVVPPAQAKLYRERVVYLPDVFVATDGFSIGVPSVTRESLAIPEDAIVFYSAQTGYKRNPTNIRVQLQAVSAVPGSTFVVKGTDDLEFKSMVMEAARASGVDNDRLRFMPADPSPWVHRANMQIADIVLDTFPYNGTTTSLEALWMGIPLVTKLGNHYAGRTSYTFLRSCDVAETVSHTDAEYIEIGRRLGTELQFREGVRRKLAEARASAAVFNGRLFARQMEAVYEQLLRRSAST